LFFYSLFALILFVNYLIYFVSVGGLYVVLK